MALRWTLLLLTLVVTLSWSFGTWPLLADPAWWQLQLAQGADWQARQPLAFALAYAAVFALLSALTLPGCAALALLAGPAFGPLAGTVLVGAASTAGALVSFLVARHWARHTVQRRWGHRLQLLEGLLARGGPAALFWLRLVPVVPFPVLNPLLGLTQLPWPRFVLTSLAGLTLGSVPYVWLGQAARQGWQDGLVAAGPLAAAALLLLGTTLWLQRRVQARTQARLAPTAKPGAAP